MLVRGTRTTTIKPLNYDIRASIHNRFDVEVVDPSTGAVKQKAVGHNVICDNLWTRLFTSPYDYFNYIFYGGGSGTPSSSDTSLFSHIGYGAVGNGSSTMDYEILTMSPAGSFLRECPASIHAIDTSVALSG